MIIRPEQPSDISDIHRVVEQSFGRPDEANLIKCIRELPDFEPALSLVAVVDEQVVGHILLSSIVIESTSKAWPALALAPLAVLPGFHRRGVGSGLVLSGLRECKLRSRPIVVVLGEPGYYSRFGFQRASEFGVFPPFNVPDEAFMIMELMDEALRGVRGTVRYSKPFEGL